ncbi:DUF4231 domain-containing protein [Streptomyces buecherae]|uniref:DUF4231 domain-containing protein n=1 Tax=Streptomyces buecherae TaxID=2763006 RepID=UPI00368363A6
MRTPDQRGVAWVWDQQSVWSQAADRAKRSIGRARTAGLALGVLGACAGTAASQLIGDHEGAGKALAFLAAVAMGLVPLIVRAAGPQQIRDWTRMRSLSEELKGEVYTCQARVASYRAEDAHQVLLERADRLTADASDLATHTSGITPRPRPLPGVSDVDSYVRLRVTGQVERYYRPRALAMRRKATLVRRAELALATTATVLGAVSGTFGAAWATAWVATVATVAAGVTAHAAASRYAYQELEFSRTAAELERLTHHRPQTADQATDDAFVSQCERVISAQNEGWMTKWLSE